MAEVRETAGTPSDADALAAERSTRGPTPSRSSSGAIRIIATPRSASICARAIDGSSGRSPSRPRIQGPREGGRSASPWPRSFPRPPQRPRREPASPAASAPDLHRHRRASVRIGARARIGPCASISPAPASGPPPASGPAAGDQARARVHARACVHARARRARSCDERERDSDGAESPSPARRHPFRDPRLAVDLLGAGATGIAGQRQRPPAVAAPSSGSCFARCRSGSEPSIAPAASTWPRRTCRRSWPRPGSRFTPGSPREPQPFAVSLRADYLVARESVTHFDSDDPSPVTQARWVSGVDTFVDASLLLSSQNRGGGGRRHRRRVVPHVRLREGRPRRDAPRVSRRRRSGLSAPVLTVA